jgi:septal ring factor EnvC (AmiA/AmiB activator)
MEADVETTEAMNCTKYSSRRGALVWFFRKSRDNWKSKYQTLKASLKREKNRVADVTKSRAKWKLKAEQANQELADLKAENAGLRARIAALEVEKKATTVSTR